MPPPWYKLTRLEAAPQIEPRVESQSQAISPTAPTLWLASRFFAFALLCFAGDLLVRVGWFRSAPDFLSFAAAILAVAGFAILRMSRRRWPLSAERDAIFKLPAERWCALGVFVAALAFYAATIFPPSPYNEQLRQAVAFVHGHIWIDAPDTFLEHAQVGPYSYSLHPPLAPILMTPVAVIRGMATNQTQFSVVLGAVGIVLAWILLGQFNLTINARTWLTLFFAAGNVFWYEAALGTTWALPMVVAVVFVLALLIELFGEARPLWLGIWGGLACLARYDAALAMPVIALLAWRRRTFSEMLWIIPGFLVVGAIFVALNEARYHTLFDVGLNYIPNTHHTGPNDPPWFGLQYLSGNINTLMFMAPRMDETFPYLHPVFSGQALTLTSPAFVLALRASFKRLEVIGMGMAAALISIPSLSAMRTDSRSSALGITFQPSRFCSR